MLVVEASLWASPKSLLVSSCPRCPSLLSGLGSAGRFSGQSCLGHQGLLSCDLSWKLGPRWGDIEVMELEGGSKDTPGLTHFQEMALPPWHHVMSSTPVPATGVPSTQDSPRTIRHQHRSLEAAARRTGQCPDPGLIPATPTGYNVNREGAAQ